jgi:hypothetical protein
MPIDHASAAPATVREAELPTGRLTLTLGAQSPSQDVDSYIGFAARDNARRGFLFVSQVLGKHVPVSPARMRSAHEALAGTIDVRPGDSFVFVGMAETATGLGYGAFEAFRRQHDAPALYVHTTRYWMDEDALTFEESHSHAPNLCLHDARDPQVRAQQQAANVLVLVDDELSTGRTFAHLLREYRARFPRIERVHVLTLCDFSGGAAMATISAATDAEVSVGALLRGQHTFAAYATGSANPQLQAQPRRHVDAGLSAGFGRRAVSTALHIDDAAGNWRELAQLPARRIKVVGTGEFMHAAYVLGSWLEARGHQVRVQSTTRSPILAGFGAIGNAVGVPDHYGEGVPNFLYNHAPADQDLVLVCCEGTANDATRGIAATLSARIVQFIHRGDGLELSVL